MKSLRLVGANFPAIAEPPPLFRPHDLINSSFSGGCLTRALAFSPPRSDKFFLFGGLSARNMLPATPRKMKSVRLGGLSRPALAFSAPRSGKFFLFGGLPRPSSFLLSVHAWPSHAMSHADISLRCFAACDCRGIRRMCPRLLPFDCKPAHIGWQQSCPRMAHC